MAKRHHIPLQLPFSAVLREEGLIQSLYPRIHYSPVEVLVYTWFCGLAVLKVSYSLNSKQLSIVKLVLKFGQWLRRDINQV